MWREDLDPKIQAVRELAGEFQALYVPLDGCVRPGGGLYRFGVLGSRRCSSLSGGNALIAEAWLNAVRA